MMGTAVPSRTKANTARTRGVLMAFSGTPTKRRLARNTRNSETWLITSAAAKSRPRVLSTRSILERNRTAASPHWMTMGRRIMRSRKEATLPMPTPIR
jgi:hypothetical protein